MKLPAIQFYPADWRKDPSVQSLSYHDKGVWFEMLCLMHESEQRGKLLINGQKMPFDALSRLLGLEKHVLEKTVSRLMAMGVASLCPETGAIINRRMIRDEEIRKKRTECGKLGGNPRLLNQNPTTLLNQKSTPSSSSSIASSSSEIKAERVTGAHPKLEQVKTKAAFIGCSPEEAEKFWNHFESSGWIDKNGHVIHNWEAKLATWSANARSKPLEEAHRAGKPQADVNRPSTVGSLQIQFDAIVEELKGMMQDQYVNLEWVKRPKPGCETQVRELKQKLKDIRRRIAAA